MEFKKGKYKGLDYKIMIDVCGFFYGKSINNIWVKEKQTFQEVEKELFNKIDLFIEKSYNNLDELTEAVNNSITLEGRDGAYIEKIDLEILLKKCSFIIFNK